VQWSESKQKERYPRQETAGLRGTHMCGLDARSFVKDVNFFCRSVQQATFRLSRLIASASQGRVCSDRMLLRSGRRLCRQRPSVAASHTRHVPKREGEPPRSGGQKYRCRSGRFSVSQTCSGIGPMPWGEVLERAEIRTSIATGGDLVVPQFAGQARPVPQYLYGSPFGPWLSHHGCNDANRGRTAYPP
jgi:hypothetical protein